MDFEFEVLFYNYFETRGISIIDNVCIKMNLKFVI